jgi:hypothetical protein
MAFFFSFTLYFPRSLDIMAKRKVPKPDWADGAMELIRDHNNLLNDPRQRDYLLGLLDRVEAYGEAVSLGIWEEIKTWSDLIAKRLG